MLKHTDTAVAALLTTSGTAQFTEAYITAILRGTTFLPKPQAAPTADRAAWFDAAAWPAAPAGR